MEKVLFRKANGRTDASALARVHEACREADGIVEGLRMEEFPSEQNIASFLDRSEPNDWVIAEVGDEVAGYGHAMHSWSERDGNHCYLHLGWVKPEWRGKGIGTKLLARLEERCREKAATEGTLNCSEYGANASSTELDAWRLLEDSGYRAIYTLLVLEFPPDAEVVPQPLPDEYEIVPVETGHHLAIWQCTGDAYYDHGHPGRGAQNPTADDYARYFAGPHTDPSLWFVAWRHTRIAGVVMCRIVDGIANVYEVNVGHAHRRKGLAKALLTHALAEVRMREPKSIQIVTKEEFITQAWRLYEQVGFRRVKSFARWRKTLA